MQSLLQKSRAWTDQAFARAMPRLNWHPDLQAYAKYLLVGAGKALRPYLVFWAYQEITGDEAMPPEWLVDWALALEMIHTYSLVHDDLPAMDNDAFRRGKPTLHVLQGDAVAILCGDALLTGAFEVLALSQTDAEPKVRALQELARAAGAGGMISGQLRDIRATSADFARHTLESLEEIHREKTGALFASALVLGAIAADPGFYFKERIERVRAWGLELGLVFQVVDDVLDASATSAELGKTAGKDAEHGTLTHVKILGVEGAQTRAAELRQNLLASAQAWGATGAAAILDFIQQRRS